MHSNPRRSNQFRTAAAGLGLVLLASVASAEPVARSFDQLASRIRPGDVVLVKDGSGVEMKGELIEVSPGSLAIAVKGDRHEWRADEVRLVKRIAKVKPNAATRGTLAVARSCDDVECLPAAMMFVGVGAIAEGVESLFRRPKTIYRAPEPSSTVARH